MRYLLGLLVLFSGSAWADEWTKADTYREGVFVGLMILDTAQTRYIAKHPEVFHETNKLEGAHPSVGRADNYGIMMTLGHAYIATLLPSGYRKAWQYFWIGIETDAVVHNYKIGIKLSW